MTPSARALTAGLLQPIPVSVVVAGVVWGGSLRGRIFFHLGDDSGFTAVREATEGRF